MKRSRSQDSKILQFPVARRTEATITSTADGTCEVTLPPDLNEAELKSLAFGLRKLSTELRSRHRALTSNESASFDTGSD